MTRLALDHLTAVDATPVDLVRTARSIACDATCMFLHSMDVLPHMPVFDLVADRGARAETKAVMADLGVSLDLAYPFTLAGRTDVASFARSMECAAQLGAASVNVLAYDRDPVRQVEKIGAFCDMAAQFDLNVAIEFYPPSQVATLGRALEVVAQIGRPGLVGVNVDLLHLMRSGGSVADLAAAPPGAILYGQLADGPVQPCGDLALEASSARLLCGEGSFDVIGFARALPRGCPLSVEIPRDEAIAHQNTAERAATAVESARLALGAPGKLPTAVAPGSGVAQGAQFVR